jgi:hemerythrin
MCKTTHSRPARSLFSPRTFLADRPYPITGRIIMQNFFPWSRELSVGIEEIDEQHKLLVDIINHIYEALINRAPREAASQLLEDLVQYTYVHFAVEESLFRITNYPDYDDHKALHDHLKKQVLQIKQSFDAGEIKLDLTLMSFLRSWLEDHIRGEDQAYAAHLLGCGLKSAWARPAWVGKIWSSLRV